VPPAGGVAGRLSSNPRSECIIKSLWPRGRPKLEPSAIQAAHELSSSKCCLNSKLRSHTLHLHSNSNTIGHLHRSSWRVDSKLAWSVCLAGFGCQSATPSRPKRSVSIHQHPQLPAIEHMQNTYIYKIVCAIVSRITHRAATPQYSVQQLI
jgi:hypothetical protein